MKLTQSHHALGKASVKQKCTKFLSGNVYPETLNFWYFLWVVCFHSGPQWFWPIEHPVKLSYSSSQQIRVDHSLNCVPEPRYISLQWKRSEDTLGSKNKWSMKYQVWFMQIVQLKCKMTSELFLLGKLDVFLVFTLNTMTIDGLPYCKRHHLNDKIGSVGHWIFLSLYHEFSFLDLFTTNEDFHNFYW